MANLVSYTIPNLIQGVSQQPDAQRDPSQGEVQINGMSSLAEGLRKREPTQAVAKVSTTSFGDVFFHQILRDTVEQYLVVIGKTAIKVFDLAGNEKTVNAPSGYSYLSSVVSAKKDIRAATIADYTFVSNTKVVPAMDVATAPKTARPATHEALVWVKAANYGQTYKVNVNGTAVSVTTPLAAVIVSGTTTTENRISSETIAESIRTGLSGVSGVTVTRSGSVLHLTSSSAITVAANDARANADITAITNSVQTFQELPTIAPNGYQVQIVGDPSNKFDGYYVQFKVRTGAGTFGEGAWEETVAPGVQYKLDPATMPHVLVRLSNGQFYFGPANGSTQSGTKIASWGERTAGDYETAPDPGFVGFAIQDVFVYKNRLGFLADENIILSRTREFFEFFPETVTTILDTDPIDLTASNNRVSVLRYAIPYQDELIIFSDQLQFRFNAAETVLTPSTAQITVLTQYEIDPDCRPLPVQGTIIFCQTNGQWTQFREFSVRGAGTALVADASDLTSYVSSYVPADVFKLTANDTGNAWFAISDKDGFEDRIYVYKYFYRNTGGGAERVQSSWSYWQFGGADRVLQFLCVQEVMYLLMQYGSEVWLEKMLVADRLSDVTPNPYPLLVDRRVSTTTETPAAIRVAAGVYDPVAKTTTWTLPYTIKALTQAWSGYAATTNGGVLLGSASSGNQIVANGNWSAAPVFFGERYGFVYRFTRFKVYKEIGGGKAAANVERTQVRHARLRYHQTNYFEAWVMAERRDKAVYKFDGTVLRSRNSQLGSAMPGGFDPETNRYFEGVFQIPIASKGENCIVEIHNDTIHPCKFSTCEWVGLVTTYARSLQ
ncbi:MAG: hypothetical protein VKI63_04465 [Cyanobium sp.]|nr:hypothetical protein [Cyanobium sp.]